MYELNEITEEDKKILEQFPEYDKKPEHYVGSRDYWESIFRSETNRDPKLHEAFSKLHEKIVNEVIMFCKEHNLDNVDEVYIHADGLMGSMSEGEWTCFTDSSMSMIEIKHDEETGWMLPDREHPFLYEI